jgi:hypothetical protein
MCYDSERGSKTKIMGKKIMQSPSRITARCARAAAGIAGAAAVLGLVLGATGGAASAAVTGTPQYSEYLAGYAGINNGLKAFNDIRWNVTAPDEPATVGAAQVAVGGVLQEFANLAKGQADPTVGLGLVWGGSNLGTDTCPAGSASDQWILEEHSETTLTQNAGLPVVPSDLTPILNGGNLICVPAGTKYYMEIHDSTLFNEIAFVAGDVEPGNTLGTGSLTAFGPGMRFYNFGIGVDTSSGAVASELSPGTLASFVRDGLTQLLAPNLSAGGTNDRLTINAENLQQFIGTQDGTSSGAVTLQPSELGTGSSFAVTAVA